MGFWYITSLIEVADIADIGVGDLEELGLVVANNEEGFIAANNKEGPSYRATPVAVASTNIVVDIVVREEILKDLGILIIGFDTSSTGGYNSLVSLCVALTKATRAFLNTDLSIGQSIR